MSYLRNNNWTSAAESYYDDCGEMLAYLADHGKPANDYYADDYANPEEAGWEAVIFMVIVALVIAAVIAGVIVRGEKAAMLTAVKKTEAAEYLDRSSLMLTKSTDQFVNTTLVATPRVQEVRTSGGGGGGGRFDGGFGGFGHSSIDIGGFGGSHGGKF